jgi:hypothetical protein
MFQSIEHFVADLGSTMMLQIMESNHAAVVQMFVGLFRVPSTLMMSKSSNNSWLLFPNRKEIHRKKKLLPCKKLRLAVPDKTLSAT